MMYEYVSSVLNDEFLAIDYLHNVDMVRLDSYEYYAKRLVIASIFCTIICLDMWCGGKEARSIGADEEVPKRASQGIIASSW